MFQRGTTIMATVNPTEIPVGVPITFHLLSVSPDETYNVETGEVVHKRDRAGVPRWALLVLGTVAGASKPEVITVKLAAVEAPTFPPMTEVRLPGLTAAAWGMSSGSGATKSGLWFSALRVEAAAGGAR